MGVALQLALLRHPGTTLAQIIRDRGAIPHDLATFVAEQIGLRVTDLAVDWRTFDAGPGVVLLTWPTRKLDGGWNGPSWPCWRNEWQHVRLILRFLRL
nr:hypothetical protein [Sphingobium sp. EP60837]